MTTKHFNQPQHFDRSLRSGFYAKWMAHMLIVISLLSLLFVSYSRLSIGNDNLKFTVVSPTHAGEKRSPVECRND